MTTHPAGFRAWPAAAPVVADGRRFALHQLGPADSSTGPAALLLHEPGRSAERWKNVAPALAADRQLLVPDLPGHGQTEAAPHTLSVAVDALIGLVLHDSAGRPVDLVGVGASASLAIAVAAARPDLVRRLVVIAGGWPATIPSGPGREPTGYTTRDRLRGLLAPLTGEGHWQPEPGSAQVGLPRPERSLVIWGTHDRVLLPRVGERVVSALGRCVDPATVTMVTLPRVGHRVVDEAPADVIALLREFLRAP